ncbi:MAG: Spy/CpxP family protein refolding chaperone [Dehalococcoidia bacterium]
MFTYGRVIAATSALIISVGGLQAQVRDTNRTTGDTAGIGAMTDRGAMRGMHGGKGGMVGMMGMMDQCPMMRGQAESPGAILRYRDSLGLSDEQVGRLEGLRDGVQTGMRQGRTEMLAAHNALREVVGAERLDEAAARAALERMGRAHTDMALAMLRSRRDALALLTAAQREELDRVAGSMMGMMPMMQMMHGGGMDMMGESAAGAMGGMMGMAMMRSMMDHCPMMHGMMGDSAQRGHR